MKLLTPEDADHAVTLSPDGRYFVDVYSTPTTPPVTVVRDNTRQAGDGRGPAGHQEAGGRRLEATDADHSEGARRQDGSLRLDVQADELRCDEEISDHQLCVSRAADGRVRQPQLYAAHGDNQALAELGFIVVCIDGMGTPWRSKAFHEAYYGDMGDNTIPDQVAGMKELAREIFVHRHRSRGDLRALRRRLRYGGGDVSLSGFLQGWHRRERQPRQPRVRGRLGEKWIRVCW